MRPILILFMLGLIQAVPGAWAGAQTGRLPALDRELPSSLVALTTKPATEKDVLKALGKPKKQEPQKQGGDLWYYNLTGLDYDLTLRFDHHALTFLKFSPISKYLRHFTASTLLAALKPDEQKKIQKQLDEGAGCHHTDSTCNQVTVKADSIGTTFEFKNAKPHPVVSVTLKGAQASGARK